MRVMLRMLGLLAATDIMSCHGDGDDDDASGHVMVTSIHVWKNAAREGFTVQLTCISFQCDAGDDMKDTQPHQ